MDLTTQPASQPLAAAATQPETALARQSQQRALAEIQAQYLMAQQFPRDQRRCIDRIVTAFARPRLAEKATYEYKRSGEAISGPSIRAAEALAQEWENVAFGFREIYRGKEADGTGFSQVEAFAHDLERRTQCVRSFQVRHWRDTRSGGYKLREERDIAELVANLAQRKVRECILAVVPGDIIELALDQADATLKAEVAITPELLAKIEKQFAEVGVSKAMLEARLQRRLDSVTPGQVLQLRRIHNSLRDGISHPGDFFEGAQPAQAAPRPTGAAAVQQAAAAVQEAAAARRAQAQPQGQAPVTYAGLEARMRAAGTAEELDACAALVDALPADQQADARTELEDNRNRLASAG